ncbi:hypothetical protein ABPG75_012976 [Micractinium tetrahymenae]
MLPRGVLACKALWAAGQAMLRSAARVEAPRAAAVEPLRQHSGTIVHVELGPLCRDPLDCSALLSAVHAVHLRSLALGAHPSVFALCAGVLPHLSALEALDLLGNAIPCDWDSTRGVAAAAPLLRSLHVGTRRRSRVPSNAEDEELLGLPAGTITALASATRLSILGLVAAWDSITEALLRNARGLQHLSIHLAYLTTKKVEELVAALRTLPRLAELHLVLANIMLLFDPDSDGADWIDNGVWDFACTPPLAGLPLRSLTIQGAVGLPPDWRQLTGLRELRVVSDPEYRDVFVGDDAPDACFRWGDQPAPGLTALSRLEVKGIMPAVAVAASLPALRVLRDIKGASTPFVLGGDTAAARLPDRLLSLLARFERGDAPALFCYRDAEQGQLQASAAMPARFGRLLYVLREPGSGSTAGCGSARGSSCATSPAGKAAAAVEEPAGSPGAPPALVGYLDGSTQPLAQLQELLVGLYMPHLLSTAIASWPEQLAQDWAAGAQGFASALVEAAHVQRGRTQLFVPLEELSDPTAAARQRELVQRLEQQLLRWTQQIRTLLDRYGSREGPGLSGRPGTGGGSTHEEGPLGEVAFWRGRTADLGSLRDQLEGARLGRVLRVLEAAKSPHLPAFLALRGSIAAEAEQAASNLAFLTALEQPCAALAAAAPPALAGVLPPVLDVLRMVWTLSPHYNTPDQMTGLLRQVSSAVLARCRATLDLPAIFEGRGLASAAAALEECCAAAAAWWALYGEAAARVSTALPARPWAFDAAAIFAHVEAFVQRCRDLQELCAAQQQFGCGPQLTSVLSGGKAVEVARALAEVQQAFAQQMGRLQGLGYNVLDVRCTQWYQDMAAFRGAVRDLEQMLGNILGGAAGQASSLAARLDIIQAFAQATTRDGLRKAVEARMSEWHGQFVDELAAVKRAFEGIKAELPLRMALPQHAGRVAVLRGLLRRIERTWDHLAGMAGHLPAVPRAAESAAAYEALHMGLQQSVSTLNNQWYASVPGDIASHMNVNLLQQDKTAGGLLRVALSPQLHAALEEAFLFSRQRLGVPPAVSELLQERPRLRSLWVSAVQVCRAYNAVLGSLSAEDRRLCRDRIRFLDRRVLPGVNKLTWASPKHQADFYHKDALRCCKDVAAAAAELQAVSAAVASTCALFREALLARVERKRLYDLADWEARQAAHQAATCARMGEAYSALRASQVSLYRRFAADSEEVQQEWLAFLRRADAQLLDALTACVRRSLHEVARALQGEHRGAEVSPVFVLSVVLDTNSRVELKPTLQQLYDTVHATCKGAVAALEGLPRLLPEVLAGCAAAGPLPACLREVEAPPSFVEVVGGSEEAVTKQMQAVTAGISGIVEKVQQLLSFHEKKYMTALWQTECTAYMRRYERANKPVSSFVADIQKYLDLKEEVLSEDSASNVRWLRLDASLLKQQLVTLCDGWVDAFQGLLTNLASRQLAGLTAELAGHIAELTGKPPPQPGQAAAGEAGVGQQDGGEASGSGQGAGSGTEPGDAGEGEAAAEAQGTDPSAPAQPQRTRRQAFDELEALHGRLQAQREELQERIGACQEKYEALVQLQAGIPDEELAGVDALPGLWADFVGALDAVPARLRQLWDA